MIATVLFLPANYQKTMTLRSPECRKAVIHRRPRSTSALPLGAVGDASVSRHVLLGYDDMYSVEYMQQKLLPYWRKEFPDFTALLKAAEREYLPLQKRAAQYDADLEHDLTQAGGPEYAAISTLAFRQAIGAHKLVEDASGVPFFMPKENFSNGSISTVDVIYPSAPMFLLLNPKLVEAQLEPVLRYAQTPRWKFPFAPHDLGVYPLANGQLYGGGEVSEDDQMPVEESGDMILMVAAVAHAETILTSPPAIGLCSPSGRTICLPRDSILKINSAPMTSPATSRTTPTSPSRQSRPSAAYAQLAEKLGDRNAATKYETAAKSMAAKWAPMAADGDHYRLAFDKAGTWSQKYNLVWDNILDLHLFPAQIADAEIAFYKTHMNAFGLPLDNRATYTKLDWTIWTATLARNPDDFKTIVHPVFDFLNQTTDRVPMTDWYDTVSAHHVGFQARSVVGGVYIKLLADPALWSKWVARAKQNDAASVHAKSPEIAVGDSCAIESRLIWLMTRVFVWLSTLWRNPSEICRTQLQVTRRCSSRALKPTPSCVRTQIRLTKSGWALNSRPVFTNPIQLDVKPAARTSDLETCCGPSNASSDC